MSTKTKAEPKKSKRLQLKWADVRMDGGTQSRAELNGDTANKYAKMKKEGVEFDPVTVFYGPDDRTPSDGKNCFWLADGFHRAKADEFNRTSTVTAEVFDGDRRAAILFAVGANAKEKLGRSNEDKRFSVRMILEDDEWWGRSDNWIATVCHVSRDLVVSVREDIEDEREEAERKAEEEEAARLAAEQAAANAKPGSTQANSNGTDTTCRTASGGSKNSTQSAQTTNNSNGQRQARSGSQAGGGTRTMNTSKIGRTKNQRNGTRVEKHPKDRAKAAARRSRSIRKGARYSIQSGQTEEEWMTECLEARQAIPIIED